MSTVLERDALNHPYIEIHSAKWLKSTLLFFPHVHQIVPGGYSPRDKQTIRRFCDTKGIGGIPLLNNVIPDGEAVCAEQDRLANRIEEYGDHFFQHFSQSITRRKYLRRRF